MAEQIKGIRINQSKNGISFDAGQIRFSCGAPRASIIESDGRECDITPGKMIKKTSYMKDSYSGSVRETRYVWMDGKGYQLTWSVGKMLGHNGVSISSCFYNGTQSRVRLKDFTLCSTDSRGIECEGSAADWVLSTLEYAVRIGNLAELLPSINETTRLMWEGYGLPSPQLPDDENSNDGRWRVYNDYLTLYKTGDGAGIVIGAAGEPEADVRYDCRVDSGRIELSMVSNMNEIVVEPGQWRRSQEVAILSGEYGSAVETMLRWTAATHGSRISRKPVTGWCSWYDLGQAISEESIGASVAAILKLEINNPLRVIQIDDGYQKQVGNWACNSRFPRGLRPIADEIVRGGAVAGIWLAPLAVHESTGLIKKHPDWFQRDKHGDLLGECNNWGPKGRWLDPTHPDARQFIRDIIRDVKKDGFRYIKIDFNAVQEGCRFYDPYKTRLQVLRDLYALYREEAGEETHLLACSDFTRGVMGFADSCRTGPDSCPIWEAKHPCTIKESIKAIGMNAIANGILFANDPDVTYLKPRGWFDPVGADEKQENPGSSLTIDEWRTWFSFVGLLGGSVMISDPLQREDYHASIRMFEIIMPPSVEKGRPFCPGADIWHTRFGFAVDKPWGSSVSMILWNPGKTSADVEIGRCIPGLPGGRFHLWSFWDEEYLGIGDKDTVIKNIAPHGCKLLRLTEIQSDERLPVLVGSNLHISMANEITDFRTNGYAAVLKLGNAGARDGVVDFYSRARPETVASCGCTIQSLSRVKQDIWRIEISGRHGNEQTITIQLLAVR